MPRTTGTLLLLLGLAGCAPPPPPAVVIEPPLDQLLSVGACHSSGAWWSCELSNKTAAPIDLGGITHSAFDTLGVRIDRGLIVGRLDAHGHGDFILGGPTNADIAKIVLTR
jgi:hypothetical protein